MPEFGNAFSGLAAKRKLTHSELVRSIRFMVAAEYEAIQLYEQLAESTDHALAHKVLENIIHEEMEHVGEFCRLLRELAPEDEEFYREGMEETEEAMAELGDSSEHSCHGHGDSCCEKQAETGRCSVEESCHTECHEGQEQQSCACEGSK